MSKIHGGGGIPPPSHHPKPHGAGKPHHAAKTEKSQRKKSEPTQIEVEAEIDVDEMEGARGMDTSSGQGGFSGERPPADPRLHETVERRAIDRAENVQTVLAEIKTKLATLCSYAPDEKPKGEGRQVPRAETVGELHDLLRTLLTGDFGFSVAQTPQVTFAALFAAVDKWPSDIPPHKSPPWGEGEWNIFLSWLTSPPPMPPPLF